MHTLGCVCDAIEKVINAVISILLTLMTVVIFYQVVLRYGFQSSNIWAEEFAVYSFIWVTLLGSACAVKRFQHFEIDFLMKIIPESVKKYITYMNYALMIVFLMVLIRYGILITMKTGNQVSAGLHIPMSMMYASVPIGSALMLLFTVQIVLEKFVFPNSAVVGPEKGE